MEASPTLLQNWLKHHAEYQAAGRKLAMVAGPGGNAGTITSGQLAAMLKTRSFPPHTTYVGTSVGAFNWLYMLIGEEYLAPTIFGCYYCDNRYFNPWKLFTRKPSLNLDYVLNKVTSHIVPIPYAKAHTSPLTITALTTNSQGHLHFLPLTGVPEANIRQALHATAAMPLIGRTHKLEELDGWDGWLVEHHLLAQLQAQGITDIVWFLNRPQKPYAQLPKTVRLLWSHIIRKLNCANPQLADLVRQRLAAGDFLQSIPNGLNVEIIPPPVDLPPNTRNPARIFHALGTSYRHMSTYLGHPNLAYPTEWAPWQHHMPQ